MRNEACRALVALRRRPFRKVFMISADHQHGATEGCTHIFRPSEMGISGTPDCLAGWVSSMCW